MAPETGIHDSIPDKWNLICNRLENIIKGQNENIATKDSQIRIMERNMEELRDINTDTVRKFNCVTQEIKTLKDLVGTVNRSLRTDRETLNRIDERLETLNHAIMTESEPLNNMAQQKWNRNCANLLSETAKEVNNLNNKFKQVPKGMRTASVHASQGPPSPPPQRPPSQPPKKDEQEVTYVKTVHQVVENKTGVQEKTAKSSENKKNEIVLIIHDSNGKGLLPDMLHATKRVKMETRYTIEDTKNNIPIYSNPNDVTDVVFLTGLNDSRQEKNTIQAIVQNQSRALSLYQRKFQKTNFHIGSVAPVALKQENLNKEFEKLAANNRASFIGTEGMIDHKTGKLRNNMLDGIHFTNIAVKVYAKEIKRSLYGHVTRRNTTNLQNPYQPQRRNTANLQNPY